MKHVVLFYLRIELIIKIVPDLTIMPPRTKSKRNSPIGVISMRTTGQALVFQIKELRKGMRTTPALFRLFLKPNSTMLCQRVRPEQLAKIMGKNWHETYKSFNSGPWTSTDLTMAEIGIHDLSVR
jgi:hypothetical protein